MVLDSLASLWAPTLGWLAAQNAGFLIISIRLIKILVCRSGGSPAIAAVRRSEGLPDRPNYDLGGLCV